MHYLGIILSASIKMYLAVVFIRIILSWVHVPPNQFTKIIGMITDPVLGFFRKYTPIRIGAIDLSIVVFFLCAISLDKLIADFMIVADGREIAAYHFYILGFLFWLSHSIINFFSFMIIIVIIIYLIATNVTPHSSHPFLESIRRMLYPILSKLQKVIKIRHRNADTIYLLLALAVVIITWIILGSILGNVHANLFEISRQSAGFQNPEYLDIQF